MIVLAVLAVIMLEAWLLMLALGAAGLAVGYWPSLLLAVVVWAIGHTNVE